MTAEKKSAAEFVKYAAGALGHSVPPWWYEVAEAMLASAEGKRILVMRQPAGKVTFLKMWRAYLGIEVKP